MKRTSVIIFVLAFLLQREVILAQSNNDCLKEVVALEEKNNYSNDTSITNKNIFISYSVKVTDWDDQIVVSNTKIYKKNEYMHFFSEQANIYQDAKEAVMILPQQRVAIINSTNKELLNTKINDAFFDMRRKFIDSCEVVRCDNVGKIKTLELKVKKNDGSHNIASMIYEYDTDLGKILFVKINYNKDFKVKQIQINYKDFNLNSTYQFASARKYLVDNNGKLLPKLKGYEFVDNRDQKKKNKK
jgi:hypothetical protein